MKYKILSEYPEYAYLIKEWSPKNDKTPSEVTLGCDKKILWVCPSGHEHSARIPDRLKGQGHGCPRCYDERRSETVRKSHTTITLWDKRGDIPELINEYRGDISLHEIAFSSHIRVLWECSVCKYSWLVAVKNRTLRGDGCPHCWEKNRSEIGRKAQTTITLWDKRDELPILIQEYLGNIPLEEIAWKSGIKVLWKCIECQHLW